MCQYSLEGFKTRDAKEGETVYSVTNHSGAFTTKAGQSLHTAQHDMVCVKDGQKMTLTNLQLTNDLGSVYPYSELVGKTHVVTMSSSSKSTLNGDHVVFSDGNKLLTTYITSSMYIGVITGDPGMKRVEEAISEGLATTPAPEKELVKL